MDPSTTLRKRISDWRSVSSACPCFSATAFMTHPSISTKADLAGALAKVMSKKNRRKRTNRVEKEV